MIDEKCLEKEIKIYIYFLVLFARSVLGALRGPTAREAVADSLISWLVLLPLMVWTVLFGAPAQDILARAMFWPGCSGGRLKKQIYMRVRLSKMWHMDRCPIEVLWRWWRNGVRLIYLVSDHRRSGC
jgi:hypothetical protein